MVPIDSFQYLLVVSVDYFVVVAGVKVAKTVVDINNYSILVVDFVNNLFVELMFVVQLD